MLGSWEGEVDRGWWKGELGGCRMWRRWKGDIGQDRKSRGDFVHAYICTYNKCKRVVGGV